MTYYTIVSNINNEVNVESFFIESELHTAMDTLEMAAELFFGKDILPLEDGVIGFYSPDGDCVYMEERNINEILRGGL